MNAKHQKHQSDSRCELKSIIWHPTIEKKCTWEGDQGKSIVHGMFTCHLSFLYHFVIGCKTDGEQWFRNMMEYQKNGKLPYGCINSNIMEAFIVLTDDAHGDSAPSVHESCDVIMMILHAWCLFAWIFGWTDLAINLMLNRSIKIYLIQKMYSSNKNGLYLCVLILFWLIVMVARHGPSSTKSMWIDHHHSFYQSVVPLSDWQCSFQLERDMESDLVTALWMAEIKVNCIMWK